jgi:CIC family chloride channel protein
MDVKPLADKGEVFTSDKDKNILLKIDVLKLIQTDYQTLSIDNSLEKVVEIFASTSQKVIPIVDEKRNLLGVIEFQDVKSFIFNPYRVKFTTIKEILSQPEAILQFDDGMEKIMNSFEKTNREVLPLLKDGKYFGCLSKLDILENYRTNFKEMVIE